MGAAEKSNNSGMLESTSENTLGVATVGLCFRGCGPRFGKVVDKMCTGMYSELQELHLHVNMSNN